MLFTPHLRALEAYTSKRTPHNSYIDLMISETKQTDKEKGNEL